jgi:CheY-like chemotaxis protein
LLNTVEIHVQDTGIGIAPEMLARVFEPFSQAERSLDRTRGGLGLGLALVKGIVELHGGEVRAASRGLGHGATFTIRLPVIASPEPDETPAPAAPSAPARLRVLVVEDNRDAAETLSDLLGLFGCTVEVTHSGAEAVEVADSFRPEVVLCDLGLPGMDGYQVAAALRRQPATSVARLIAISGYGQEDDRRRSREAGFDLHLTKPIDAEELQRLLQLQPAQAWG